MAKKVKYMGTSDVVVLDKGETFDGRLPDGLSRGLRFDLENKWVEDLSDLNADELELVLADGRFKDVSDLKRIPSNDHEKMFRGHSASEPNPEVEDVQGAGANPDAGGTPPVTTVGGSVKGKR